jgi:homoserine kinase type II
MSVYTSVERSELEALLRNYSIGRLVDLEGISDGIENTNYFVTTTEGRYVLTLFEILPRDELPYYLDLMAYLAEHGIPSAHPVADHDDRYLQELSDKSAVLVHCLRGASILNPTPPHCAAIGSMLGRMHIVGKGYTGYRENDRGPQWWKTAAAQLLPRLDAINARRLNDEIAFQAQHDVAGLPGGVIHADLFRDNALFVGNQLTGVIDFYYACNDVFLFDLAVTVNDWCSHPDGGLDSVKLNVLLKAYQQERPFTATERGMWPVMLRAAALRFWVSRLQDLHFPRPGEITHTKDPEVFRRILCHRVDNEDTIRRLWDAAA